MTVQGWVKLVPGFGNKKYIVPFLLNPAWETRNANLEGLLIFTEMRLELASECFLALLHCRDLLAGSNVVLQVVVLGHHGWQVVEALRLVEGRPDK